MATKTKKKVKREKRNIPEGIVYVQATFNNTIVTITDRNGNVISWASAGKKGFKGAKKSTPYAARIISTDAASKAIETVNLRDVDVRVKGPGGGREAAIRASHLVYKAHYLNQDRIIASEHEISLEGPSQVDWRL